MQKTVIPRCTSQRNSSGISASTYVIPTNSKECLNYNSLCPTKYKNAVISTLLHRSCLINSSWDCFHTDILRIRSLLCNNDFPINIVDKKINVLLSSKMQPNQEPHKKSPLFSFTGVNSQASISKTKEQ